MDTLTAPTTRPRVAQAIEKQGAMECMLATLAALGGKPLAEVIRVALAEAQRHQAGAETWADTISTRDRTYTAYSQGVLAAATFCGVNPAMVRPELRNAGIMLVLSKRLRSLPAKGRGVVRLQLSATAIGHIMPYEDGLCYDPNMPDKGHTLHEIRTMYRGWTVSFIHQEG